jgi:hypothetical protein
MFSEEQIIEAFKKCLERNSKVFPEELINKLKFPDSEFAEGEVVSYCDGNHYTRWTNESKRNPTVHTLTQKEHGPAVWKLVTALEQIAILTTNAEVGDLFTIKKIAKKYLLEYKRRHSNA